MCECVWERHYRWSSRKNEHHLRFFSLSLSLLPLCITSSIHNVWCAFCVFQCVTFKSVVEVAAVISISCIESICSVCRLVVGFLFAFFYCIDNCKCVNMCVCRFSIIVFCHQLFLFSSLPRALLLSRPFYFLLARSFAFTRFLFSLSCVCVLCLMVQNDWVCVYVFAHFVSFCICCNCQNHTKEPYSTHSAIETITITKTKTKKSNKLSEQKMKRKIHITYYAYVVCLSVCVCLYFDCYLFCFPFF